MKHIDKNCDQTASQASKQHAQRTSNAGVGGAGKLSLNSDEGGAHKNTREHDAIPSKNFTVTIEHYRKALFFSRSRISIQLVSEEAPQFSVQFGQVSKSILDWGIGHGKKAKSVHLKFYCKTWIADKVEPALSHLMAAEAPYDFLSKAQINVWIYDLSGHLIKEI